MHPLNRYLKKSLKLSCSSILEVSEPSMILSHVISLRSFVFFALCLITTHLRIAVYFYFSIFLSYLSYPW